MGGFQRENIQAALDAGAKLVVIDPKKIQLARRADLWIAPRPQSDGALAMGFIKVIIEEKLYDVDFVSKWTIGFDQLEAEIKKFSLEDVEKATWVPKDQILKAAKMFTDPGSQPVCYVDGNGMERNIHSFQIARAVNILRALSGPINVPGSNTLFTSAPFAKMGRFYFPKGNTRNIDRGLCSPFKVGAPGAYVPPQSLVKAILDEKPYPIKAVINMLTNPLVSYPDTEATYRAFMKLDFLVVSELFPTPTSAIADIVLPAAWGGEHEAAGYWPGWRLAIRAYPKIVDPPGEAKPNAEWINELAKRVGLREFFWENWKDCLDEIVKPAGITFEQLKEKRCLDATRECRKPEEGIFRTSSGKVEFYSNMLKQLGYSPIPNFQELTRFCYEPSQEYPLLMFNGKEPAFMNNGYKHVKLARARKPYPTVDLNPDTAARLGLHEGEWVYIETKKGRIKQILKLDRDLHPGLVFPSMGWWFPEEPEDLFQFKKSNINVLTFIEQPDDPEVGATELGAIPCRVYSAERE
jgi:anaerobic selenocysteine-containing dehydrogenase